MDASSVVGDLATVLAVAAPAALVTRRIGLPPILGYLGAGLIIGPYLPIPIFADEARVHALSELGVVLVMFVVGLELRVRRLLEVLPTAGATALIEVAVMLGCGYGAGRALGWDVTASVFLGAAIAISSTMVSGRVLEEQRVERSAREFVMSVLVVQDVLAIVLAAVLTAVAAGQGLSVGEVGRVVGGLTVAIVGMVALGMLVVPRLVRRVVGSGSREMVLVLCTALCFGLAFVAHELGYSVALGAFIAGVLVAESGKAHEVEEVVQPLRDLFAAVFFVAIGMTVDPRAALDSAGLSFAVAAIVIVAQLLSVSTIGLLSGNGLRRSLLAGLALGQVGEFGFILAAIGIEADLVPARLRAVVVTVAVLTAFTTPLAVRLSDRILRAVDRALPRRVQSLLSLYTAWFEDLRRGPTGTSRRATRVALVLATEAAVIAAIAGAVAVWAEPLRIQVTHIVGLGPPLDLVVVVALAAAVAALPAYGFLHASRAFARGVAARLFDDDSPRLRAVLQGAIQLLLLVTAGVPCVVILLPVMGPGPLVALLVLVLPGAAVVWRRSGQAERNLRSSAERLARLIASSSAASSTPTAPTESSIGLGPENLDACRLSEGAHAVGRTLAQLDLRALTGASVVAIQGADGEQRFPTPSEPIRGGEVLVLAGPHTAVRQARALLEQGRLEDDPDDGAAPAP